MMKRSFTYITVAALLLLGISCGNRTKKVSEGELSGNITLSGAFALYPLAVRWADEFRALNPGVRIDISAGGAGKGMTDVLAGVVDLGMVSREVYAAETQQGALVFPVAKDAVVAVVNSANPMLDELLKSGLSRHRAAELWLGEDEKTLHAYTRSDACGAAETWAQWMGAKQEDLGGTAVFGDPGLAQAVQRDRLGIGFANLSYACDETTRLPNEGLAILPLDSNDNGVIDDEERFYDTKDTIIAAIAADKYPSPPARDLYLVAKGRPDNEAVRQFLRFILTDGQQYNIPAGYIALSDEKLQAGLEKLQ
jgi:phosphate transport system substrate-binding protein